ncbi:HEPN domain-containing protein [Methanobacterium sp.]|uniref:HEPN domain-containing protein n=1 Tax=Methanobacterium sp. TaxID=2164 RepID=UPI003C74A097
MKYNFKRYKKGNIVQICIDYELIEKEIKEARYDLESAKNSIKSGNYKWAIVQSYYSMFHAFRGLLFSRGYKEKSHSGLKFAIKTLFVNYGVISDDIFLDFDSAMKAREMADYSYIYNEETALNMIQSTKKLIDKVESLL